MAGTPIDIKDLIHPDDLATEIVKKYMSWSDHRSGWLDEKVELRNYVFATDTKTTTNNKNGWSNSTTTPKLTQIYDNLKANYSAALFPNSDWMKWEAEDGDSAAKDKATVIKDYLENKLRQDNFETTADLLVDDFVLYGNCFATVEFVTEYNTVGQEVIPSYIGPRVKRISPYDIVFDPTVAKFDMAPKIIREITSLGALKELANNGDEAAERVLSRSLEGRRRVIRNDNIEKSNAYTADGFSSIENYYQSDFVELLTFYGSIYDQETGELKTNRKIVIADRAYIVYDEEIPSWLGKAPVVHAGWRNRPDNLYAMGPLDNLVGLQYRIDHLENLKADIFDQIALPVLKVRGEVEDFEFMPGERIYMGEEGDVAPMVPDATALNADFQIQVLEAKMEELAGAPRQAMGIRTPGEKTAFEVQSLQNAAGRIFQHKAAKFEKECLEPILNLMLEASRRNMDAGDLVRTLDDATGAFLFREVSKEDITAKGKIVPKGARHFAERAARVQSLTQLVQVKQGDPSIAAHLSGKMIAKIISEELNEPELYGENVAIKEQAASQEAMLDAEADMNETMEIKAEQGL